MSCDFHFLLWTVALIHKRYHFNVFDLKSAADLVIILYLPFLKYIYLFTNDTLYLKEM